MRKLMIKMGTLLFLISLCMPSFRISAKSKEVNLIKNDPFLDVAESKSIKISWNRDDGVVPAEKIHPELQEKFSYLEANDTITVAIWLDMTLNEMSTRPEISLGFGNIDRQMSKDTNALRTEKIHDIQTKVADIQHPILGALSEKGKLPIYISPIAPLIYVEMTAPEIRTIAKRSDVDMVYGPNKNIDHMDVAKSTHFADIVDDIWGYDGAGVDVGILEDSRIEFDNPYLNSGTTRMPDDPNVDQHATAVGGVVASQHPTYQGIAQGVNLFSANATDYSDANLAAAMDWAAVDMDVDIINNSWGTSGDDSGALNEHARHLDYIVRQIWATVTVAAGNDGTTTEFVANPGKGFNVITVGSFDDQGTVDWCDDEMGAFSNWRDPDTGVQKPEVVASGTSITSTTDESPWFDNVGSDTSYAAPIVAGEAALIVEASGSNLSNYPETIKAIIMATAVHNIEGDSRLSEYDGAGGVDIRRGVRLAKDGPWYWNDLELTDFPYQKTYFLKKGERVRAVVTWDSNPTSDYTSDPLDADLNLSVKDPDGLEIAHSSSVSNPYEIVEFTSEKSGDYSFIVDQGRFEGSQEFVGFAIWPGDRKTTADFDKNYHTDLSVFKVEPWGGMWYLQGMAAYSWGNSESIPAPRDYDGNGDVDIAVYNDGTWYVKDQFVDTWGDADSIPVPGDYDGDGDADLAVFKVESWGGMWYIKDQYPHGYGNSESIPVPGDYDGDGAMDVAVYNDGTWYVKGQFVEVWGDADSIPVPGDYDGDGVTDLAVFKVEPWGGMWYIKDQSAHGYGNSESVPVPGDYNGDGTTDVAVYNDGTWYIKDQFVDTWGDSISYPLPAPDTNGDGDPYQ